MNYREIYEFRFNELLNTTKKLSKKLDYDDKDSNDMIIDISGNTFREYKYVLSTSESWAIDTINKIIKNMFTQSEIEYEKVEYTTKEISRESRPPISFVLNQEGKKEGYVFSYGFTMRLGRLRERIKKNTNIEKLHFIYLFREQNKNIDKLNDIEETDDGSFIHFEIFKDFFIKHFGKEEYEIFLEYANKFNEEVKNTIGLKLHSVPTKEVLNGFKKKTISDICSVDYYDLLEKAENKQASTGVESGYTRYVINDADKELLYQNYITFEHYKLLFSDNLFSHSFLGSEWLYKTNVIIDDVFDITGLVTGYLKSIEQLIYSYIRLYLGDFVSDKYILYKNKREVQNGISNHSIIEQEVNFDNGTIKFLSEYEIYFDKTLGALIRFISNKEDTSSHSFNNSDMFCISDSTVYNLIQFIIDELYNFKNEDRNGYLHQNNLYKKEVLDGIRKDALLLYFLLIGSFKIDEEKMITLGYVIDNDNKEISDIELKNKIEEWIYPIIRFNFPKDCHIIAFDVFYHQGKKIWDLNITGLAETPKELYQTVEWNYRQMKMPESFNNFEIDNLPEDWEYSLKKITTALKSIIYSNSLVGKSMRSYSEILIGTYHVIETLYEKPTN